MWIFIEVIFYLPTKQLFISYNSHSYISYYFIKTYLYDYMTIKGVGTLVSSFVYTWNWIKLITWLFLCLLLVLSLSLTILCA